MDTTDPLIRFNERGECNHCLWVEKIKEKWRPEGDEAELSRLVDRLRADGRGRDYDAILGLSGGVDSSYLAYLASNLGLRILVVHVDTGWNSELAVRNIEVIVKRLGIDLHTDVVDWEEMQDLQYAFFKSGVPNLDVPQDHAIASGYLNFAAKYGVKWALSGDNFACESILPKAWGHDAMDVRHIRDIHQRFGRTRLRTFPTMSYFRLGIVHRLLRGMRVARPLNLIRYTMSKAIETLEAEFGWRYYGGKHYESRFTRFFQAHYLPTKWGYDKRLAHLSSLVASSQISRVEALSELHNGKLPTDEIASDRRYMVRKLGVDEQEFASLMDVRPTPHENYATTSRNVRRMFNIWKYLKRDFG